MTRGNLRIELGLEETKKPSPRGNLRTELGLDTQPEKKRGNLKELLRESLPDRAVKRSVTTVGEKLGDVMSGMAVSDAPETAVFSGGDITDVSPETRSFAKGTGKGIVKGIVPHIISPEYGITDPSELKGEKAGEFMGAAIPIGGIYKGLSKIPVLAKYGIVEDLVAGTLYGQYEGKGAIDAAKEGAMFAAIGIPMRAGGAAVKKVAEKAEKYIREFDALGIPELDLRDVYVKMREVNIPTKTAADVVRDMEPGEAGKVLDELGKLKNIKSESEVSTRLNKQHRETLTEFADRVGVSVREAIAMKNPTALEMQGGFLNLKGRAKYDKAMSGGIDKSINLEGFENIISTHRTPAFKPNKKYPWNDTFSLKNSLKKRFIDTPAADGRPHFSPNEAEKLTNDVLANFNMMQADIVETHNYVRTWYDPVLAHCQPAMVSTTTGAQRIMPPEEILHYGELYAFSKDFMARKLEWSTPGEKLPFGYEIDDIVVIHDEIAGKIERGELPASVDDVANEIIAIFKKEGMIFEDWGIYEPGTISSHPSYIPHDVIMQNSNWELYNRLRKGYSTVTLPHTKKYVGSEKPIFTNMKELGDAYISEHRLAVSRIKNSMEIFGKAHNPEMEGIPGWETVHLFPDDYRGPIGNIARTHRRTQVDLYQMLRKDITDEALLKQFDDEFASWLKLNEAKEKYIVPRGLVEWVEKFTVGREHNPIIEEVMRAQKYAKRNFTYNLHLATLKYHLTNAFGDTQMLFLLSDNVPGALAELPAAAKFINRDLKEAGIGENVRRIFSTKSDALNGISERIAKLEKSGKKSGELEKLKALKEELMLGEVRGNKFTGEDEIFWNELKQTGLLETNILGEAQRFSIHDIKSKGTGSITDVAASDRFLKSVRGKTYSELTPTERLKSLGMEKSGPLTKGKESIAGFIEKYRAAGVGRENMYRAAVYLAERRAGKSIGEALNAVDSVLIDYTRKTPSEKFISDVLYPFYMFPKGAITNNFRAITGRRGWEVLLKTAVLGNGLNLGFRLWGISQHPEVTDKIYRNKPWIAKNPFHVTDIVTKNNGRIVLSFPSPFGELGDTVGFGDMLNSMIARDGDTIDWSRTIKEAPGNAKGLPHIVGNAMYQRYREASGMIAKIPYGLMTGQDLYSGWKFVDEDETYWLPWWEGPDDSVGFFNLADKIQNSDEFEELWRSVVTGDLDHYDNADIRSGKFLKYAKFIVRNMERNLSSLDQLSYTDEHYAFLRTMIPGIYIYYEDREDAVNAQNQKNWAKFWRNFWRLEGPAEGQNEKTDHKF